jgi:hypothetical protein
MSNRLIRGAAEKYRNRHSGPDTVWHVTLASLPPESAFLVLCELPAEDQATLRATFRPSYLEDCDNDGVRLAVTQWFSISN